MDIDRQTFITLFKDLVSRLYDRVAVESHPLTAYFPLPSNSTVRPADIVKNLVVEEIEQLRPQGDEIPLSQEWRPYLILRQRYIEGRDLRSIAASLYIGDRQFRRDHSRALQVLSTWVWQKYFEKKVSESEAKGIEVSEDQEEFEFHADKLDLNEVVKGMEPIIRRRLEMENVRLKLKLSETQLHIFTDRVLLRQIILSLLNFILHIHDQPTLTIRTEGGKNISFQILFSADEQWASIQTDEQDSLELVRRLCQRLPATMEETGPQPGQAGPAEMSLIFTCYSPRRALIVDDQDAAQKMYQRYLSQTNLEVVGVTNPAQVLNIIQEMQPAFVILDVMMPHIDGWEVLQTLQLAPSTKHIPVIVCSAWGEPELARALGAVAFLKKPVIQKELLAVLSRLDLIQE